MAKGAVTIDLFGSDELKFGLNVLQFYTTGTVLQKAVKKSARVLVPPLRRATPKSKKKFGKQASRNPSGGMRKSTGLVFRKYKNGKVQSAYVGHRWPKGAAAHLVSLGTTDRFRKTTRRGYTGFVKGTDFFKNTIDPLRTQVQATMRQALKEGIEQAKHRAAMKALKKATR